MNSVTIVTRCDADDAVVMSLDYYNSLMERVYLLKSPANTAYLATSIAQYQTGKTTVHELVDVIDIEDALLSSYWFKTHPIRCNILGRVLILKMVIKMR